MLCKKRSSAHARSEGADIPRPTCADDRDGHSGEAFRSEFDVSPLALLAVQRSEDGPKRHPQRLISAKAVRELLGNISAMTLWRWTRRRALGFPRPIYIGRRRFWREADILAWLVAQRDRDAD